MVGKSGVEQSYDSLLRGQDGSQDIIVDSHGREVGILGREPAVAGQGLKLTIDLDLQRAAEAAMGDHNAAIVAINPPYRRGSGVGLKAQFSTPTTSRCGSRETSGTS